LGERVAWTATNELRADLLRHCLGLDLGFHNATNPGTLLERIDGDVSLLAKFFSELFIRIFGSFLLMIGILIVLFSEDARLGLVFVGFTLTVLLILFRVRNIAVQPQKALREANAQLSGYLEERLSGIEDLRANGGGVYIIQGLFRLQALIRQSWSRAVRFQALLQSTSGMILTFGYVVAFITGDFFYNSGVLSLGGVYLIVNYMTLLNRPLMELSQQVDSLQDISASVERIEELFATTNAFPEPTEPSTIASGAAKIEFEAVQFAYQVGTPVLDSVSFTVEAGQVLGIVGRTGSGKSTIARLLVRFYDPQSGQIKLNGVDVRSLALHDLRRQSAFVTQEVQLFEGSIRDNLTFFDECISDADIYNAFDLLEIGAWLRALPHGLDTPLQAGGQQVSAGEAQLLAFARALLRQPSIVLLDEASSRLDPSTEAQIERAIEGLLTGRTGIIIAHRLKTLRHVDHILILEDGRVVEYGARTALASDPNSRYTRLLQLGDQVLQ
jgi:ATP-binding cassette subfamily B protein